MRLRHGEGVMFSDCDDQWQAETDVIHDLKGIDLEKIDELCHEWFSTASNLLQEPFVRTSIIFHPVKFVYLN